MIRPTRPWALVACTVLAGCLPKPSAVSAVKDTTTIGTRTEDLTKFKASDGTDAALLQAEVPLLAAQGKTLSLECLTAQTKKITDYYKANDPTNPWVTDLTDTELTGIRIYTGNSYYYINQLLRAQDADGLKAWEGIIASAASGLNKLNAKRSYRDTVERGATLDASKIQKYKDALSQNKPITERAFVSSSYAGGGFSGSVKFQIKGKTGIRVDEISMFPNEKEVLFPPGAEFLVKSIDVKKLPPSPAPEGAGPAWDDGQVPAACQPPPGTPGAPGSGSATTGKATPVSSSSVSLADTSADPASGDSTAFRGDHFTDSDGIGEVTQLAGDLPQNTDTQTALALLGRVTKTPGTSGGQVARGALGLDDASPVSPDSGNDLPASDGSSGGAGGAGGAPGAPGPDQDVTVIVMEEVTGT